MTVNVTIYGIANCDQVKKARTWLAAHKDELDEVNFHDVKKAGIDRVMLTSWMQQIDWNVLLNRKGTTWRGLSDERKAMVIDAESAATLMLEQPSIIKRPVLVLAEQTVVGFSEPLYASLFKKLIKKTYE